MRGRAGLNLANIGIAGGRANVHMGVDPPRSTARMGRPGIGALRSLPRLISAAQSSSIRVPTGRR